MTTIETTMEIIYLAIDLSKFLQFDYEYSNVPDEVQPTLYNAQMYR